MELYENVKVTNFFAVRKGLTTTHLMPFLDLKTKLLVLPISCRDIRSFFVDQNYQRHFYNCFASNYLPYLEQEELSEMLIFVVKQLENLTDWNEMRSLVSKNRYARFFTEHVPDFDLLDSVSKAKILSIPEYWYGKSAD